MILQQLYDALHHGLGMIDSFAIFQSYENVFYDRSQKGIERSRNACKLPGGCYLKRSVRALLMK